MPTDRTWAPEVVEKMRKALAGIEREVKYDDGSWSSVERLPADLLDAATDTALSASPLAAAMDLIERMEKVCDFPELGRLKADVVTFLSKYRGE